MSNLPSIQLTLNGEPVYLMEFKATAKMNRETEDMSGQESSTAKSNKGIKAKELHITGLVPFNRREWLSAIFQMAESEDEKGNQTVYRIANLSAETVNMREGVFKGEVTAEEQSVQGWVVSFVLAEENSVAEKKANRKQKPESKTQSEKGSEQVKASKPKTTKTKTTKAKSTASKTAKPKKAKTSKAKSNNTGGSSGFTVFLD